MQLVASLSFFRHFISRALRLGVVVLALFTILLSSLVPGGIVLADNHFGESDSGLPGDPLGSVDSISEAGAGLATGTAIAAVPGGAVLGGAVGTYFFTDKTISLLITALAAIYSAIGKAIGYLIPTIIGILINVLNYNSFGDSFVVTIGWPIMRDLVNMSVIIILLAIAIRTMVGMGGGAQGAQQAIGRVFLAVVLVNFSKTITLLLIDASQVVMLTFVNALDVATGNFVELFQINAILSTSWNVVGNIDLESDVPSAVGFLVNSFLSTFLLAIVLMTLVILGIVFVYRVVVLWMLVVLSPVAMFFYGLGDTLPGASGAVSEWRKRFVGALTIGPILAFFLWLSLAAASQGAALAETEGFTFFENEVASSFLEIFQPAKLLSLGLGIMLLVIGMQLAASSAASLGEFSGNLVAKLPGWSAKLAKMSTLGVAKTTGKFVGKQVELKTKIGQDFGSRIGGLGARLQNSNIPGGALVGGYVAGAGGRVENYAESISSDEKKKAQEAVKNYTSEQAAGMAMLIASGNDKKSVMTTRQRMEADEYKKRVATDKNFADKTRSGLESQGRTASEVDAAITAIDSAYVNMTDTERADAFGDDKVKKELDTKTRLAKAHLITDQPAVNGKPGKTRAQIIGKLVESMKPEEVLRELTKESMRDPELMLALHRKTTGRRPDGSVVTLFDDALAAARGTKQDVQEAARDWANGADYERQLAQNPLMTNAEREQIMIDFIGRGGAAVPGAVPPPVPPPPADDLNKPTLTAGDVERLVRAGERVDLPNLQVGGVVDAGRVEVVAQGLANAHIDLSGMTAAVATPIVAELKKQRDAATTAGDVSKAAKYLATLASAQSTTAGSITEMGFAPNGMFASPNVDRQKTSTRAINIVVNNRPTEIHKLSAGVSAGSDLNKAMMKSVTNKTISALETELTKAERSGDVAMQGNIQKSMDTIRGMIGMEVPTLLASARAEDRAEARRLADLDKRLEALEVFGGNP